MKNYSRLFDLFHNQLKEFPQTDALSYKVDGSWVKFSTGEIVDIMNNLSKGFLDLGVQKGDKIAITSSNNRPEWNFLDHGMMQVGAINVPVYPTISPTDFEYIFNHSEVTIAFAATKDLADKIASIKDKVPTLKEIYTFDDVEGYKSWKEILEKGKSLNNQAEVEAIKDSIDSKELATIVYTSGTTGLPKGVMLSHENIISNVKAVVDLLPLKSDHIALSFLPLCHVFERMVTYTYFAIGVSIYYAESMETIGDNIREVQPHFFTAVPRLLEKVYEKIMNKGYDLTGVKKSLFFWAVELGHKYDLQKDHGWWYNTQLKLANKLIFNKWREALGGRLIGMFSGSAPLQERLARVFSAANIAVREGYGLTETSPGLAFNQFTKGNAMFGTVGRAVPGVELKLAEDGEILAKGPNVMMGYYKEPQKTAEVMSEDGWFHTGDIGEFINGTFLKITDRKKELLKTSGGKYVAPAPIENKFKESPFIEQMMVVGEGKKFVSALFVPSFEKIKDWCEEEGISCADVNTMLCDEKVIAKYREIVKKYNPLFSHIEQIKEFKLLPQEWTIDGGELTPTLKIKRKAIRSKYESEINAIYGV